MKLKISIVLILASFIPLNCLANTNVQARFERSLKDAMSLTNYEIHWLDYLYMPDPANSKSTKVIPPHLSRTFEYSYIASGAKVHAAWKLVSSNQTNVATLCESAFDGKSFHTYYKDSRYITIGTNQPEATAESGDNPLTAPFMFLTKDSDKCKGCILRFADIIHQGPANTLIPTATDISDGMITISIAGLPYKGSPVMWKVVMDAEGDSFTPKLITVEVSGKYEKICKLLDYTNFGNYCFPSRMEWAESLLGASPALLANGTVTLVSASIPDRLDDSVFTLEDEEKTANVIWNRDQKKLIKEGPRIPMHKPARIIALRVIIVATILILPVILAWKKMAVNRQK